jgi:hypothetical protein
MTIDSSIKTKYFDNQSCKVLDANLNHNCVTGLHNVGNSKVIAWLFCIMIWWEMFQDQVYFHKKKLGSSLDQKLNQWFPQKKMNI